MLKFGTSGWRALIATEIIVGTSGIGFLMFDARRAGSVVEILLGMIILGTLWYIVDSWILAPIEREARRRGLATYMGNVRFSLASLGNDAGMIGAAAQMFPLTA